LYYIVSELYASTKSSESALFKAIQMTFEVRTPKAAISVALPIIGKILSITLTKG